MNCLNRIVFFASVTGVLSVTNLSGCKTTSESDAKSHFDAKGVDLSKVDVRNFPNINPHSDIDKRAYAAIVGSEVMKKFESQEKVGNEPQLGAFLDGSEGVSLSEKQTHGPLIGGSEVCPGLEAAIHVVNRALVAEGQCRGWFDKRGPVAGPFYVMPAKVKLTCLTSAPTWTYPYYNHIGFCMWACGKDKIEIASLLIHELGHHYCPAFVGREDCAISAQTACENELR